MASDKDLKTLIVEINTLLDEAEAHCRISREAEEAGELARHLGHWQATLMRLEADLRRSTAAKNATLNVGGINLALIPIEPGTFLMGSPPTEKGRFAEETQHQVTLTHKFLMGKYAVTQSQYEIVMKENPSQFKGARRPVDSVSWYQAMEFCRRLTVEQRAAGMIAPDQLYRLPTESEWEYCCRAGTTTAFSFGPTLDRTMARCDPPAREGTSEAPVEGTAEVGTLPPNAWRLHDMHGNVYEWCADWFAIAKADPLKDPKGPARGVVRLLRGGGWTSRPEYCRCANRFRNDPAVASNNVGFRVVMADDEVPEKDQFRGPTSP